MKVLGEIEEGFCFFDDPLFDEAQAGRFLEVATDESLKLPSYRGVGGQFTNTADYWHRPFLLREDSRGVIPDVIGGCAAKLKDLVRDMDDEFSGIDLPE